MLSKVERSVTGEFPKCKDVSWFPFGGAVADPNSSCRDTIMHFVNGRLYTGQPTGSEVSVRLEVAGCGRVEDEDGMLVRGKRVKKDIGLSGEGPGCVSISYVAGFPGKSL